MRKNRHPQELKQQIVKEAIEVGNASLVARRYNISVATVNYWVRQNLGITNPIKKAAMAACSEEKGLTAENLQLKKLLGEKDLEIAILKDLLKKKNCQS